MNRAIWLNWVRRWSVEFENLSGIQVLKQVAPKNEITIDDIETETRSVHNGAAVVAVVSLRLSTKIVRTEIIKDIGKMEGVLYNEEV